ncbi:transposase family protein [Dactylosporangium darangshiense]|uniref:transposase family protein n=1 Tax=Dactylosporangium darangshiense TaxID=579108 RepID=UPI00362FA7A8
MQHNEQRDLLRALAAVPDPRHRRGVRYRLVSLLAVAVCAVLAGATTFAAIGDWAADLDEAARRQLGSSAVSRPAVRCGGSWSASTRRYYRRC